MRKERVTENNTEMFDSVGEELKIQNLSHTIQDSRQRMTYLFSKGELSLEEKQELMGLVTRSDISKYKNHFAAFRYLTSKIGLGWKKSGNLTEEIYSTLLENGVPAHYGSRKTSENGKKKIAHYGYIFTEDEERAVEVLKNAALDKFSTAAYGIAYGPDNETIPSLRNIRFNGNYVSVGTVIKDIIKRKDHYSFLLIDSPVPIYFYKQHRGFSYFVSKDDIPALYEHVKRTLAEGLCLNIFSDWEKSQDKSSKIRKNLFAEISNISSDLETADSQAMWIYEAIEVYKRRNYFSSKRAIELTKEVTDLIEDSLREGRSMETIKFASFLYIENARLSISRERRSKAVSFDRPLSANTETTLHNYYAADDSTEDDAIQGVEPEFEDVIKVYQQLSSNVREVVTARAIDGSSFEEIASNLNMSVEQIQEMYDSGITYLRSQLALVA